MARALKVCSKPGCPTLVAAGRCPTHTRADDRARGTATQRGYNDPGHTQRFRPGVLRKHPLCACDAEPCGTLHRPGQCYTPSTVADHHPLSKRELTELGMDDDDPDHGRGLCAGCHGRHTSIAQPGGWNARTV
jgi:5-methylcytosine-specific restriction protein A